MNLPHLVDRAALVTTLVVVFWRGRWLEKFGIAMVAVGYAATPLVQRRDSWFQPQFGFMAVDGVILAVLVAIAFRYNRSWPICAAAFQAIAMLTHFAFLADPHALYRAYYFGNFAIGYLILGSILGGALIERGEPVRRRGPPSPNPLRGPSP